MNLESSQSCDHKPIWVGQIAVAGCASCARIDWLSRQGRVDPAEAVIALFGSYDLVGPLRALAAPAPTVLAYRPPTAAKRHALDALPKGVWLKAAPHLWLAHDGATLLLAPTERILFDNLNRGA